MSALPAIYDAPPKGSIVAQPGPQTAFLRCKADVAIYGGAAGGGKSFGLLLDPLQYIQKPGFGAVIFRRTSPELRRTGGLWPESLGLYPMLSGKSRDQSMEWYFHGGTTSIKFSHLQYERDKYAWKGAQIGMIGWDELTSFTESQFWYLYSRNRSTCGVRAYMRGTTNPDADSWVATLLEWYIDQETGYAIPERAGVIRYFVRTETHTLWGDSRAEALALAEERDPGEEHEAKSFTFIPANLDDNPALTTKDPGYRSILLNMSPVERERLLRGNWKIKAGAGLVFKRSWWRFYKPHELPSREALFTVIQVWDTAYSTKSRASYSVCATWASGPAGFYLLHIYRGRIEFPDLVDMAFTLHRQWRPDAVYIEYKASGPSLIQAMRRGRPVPEGEQRRHIAIIPLEAEVDKLSRANGQVPQIQAGNVLLPEGAPFTDTFIEEHAAFPDGAHDDIVDTTVHALRRLVHGPPGGAIPEEEEPTGDGHYTPEDDLPVAPNHVLPRLEASDRQAADWGALLERGKPAPVAEEPLDFAGATFKRS